MKIPSLVSLTGPAGIVSLRQPDGSATTGIELQNYYNVRIAGGDAGFARCGTVFGDLTAAGGFLVKRCNDGGWGCYRRINWLGPNGINGLRTALANSIALHNYDLAAEVDYGPSCGG